MAQGLLWCWALYQVRGPERWLIRGNLFVAPEAAMADTDNVGKALDLMGQLAGKLGQTAETLWPYMVRHTYFDALAGVGGGLVLMGLSFFFFRAVYRMVRDDDTHVMPPFIMGCSLFLFGFLMVELNFANLFAPEAGAVSSLIREVRGQ